MDLKTYLSPMTPEQREAFAKRCGCSRGHLQNVAYGKQCDARLAAAIWLESGRKVPREHLRPDDYWRIWPDLKSPKRLAKVA